MYKLNRAWLCKGAQCTWVIHFIDASSFSEHDLKRLSCDPNRGSHKSQSHHIWGDWLSRDSLRGSHDSQSPHIRKHLFPILWQLWFICHKFIHKGWYVTFKIKCIYLCCLHIGNQRNTLQSVSLGKIGNDSKMVITIKNIRTDRASSRLLTDSDING